MNPLDPWGLDYYSRTKELHFTSLCGVHNNIFQASYVGRRRAPLSDRELTLNSLQTRYTMPICFKSHISLELLWLLLMIFSIAIR